MPTEEEIADGLPIRYYQGHPFPGPMILKEETVESAINYRPRDGDIVVCGFPKTGCTWTSYIVYHILHDKDSSPDMPEMVCEIFPFMEKVGGEFLDKLPEPRAYVTFIPGQFLKINDKAKYIYLHRKPEDALVSYYEGNQKFRQPKFGLDFFYKAYTDGKVPHGDIFNHVLSFYPYKNRENFLFVSFEDLRRDTRAQVLRIAKFLGEDYQKKLLDDDEKRLSKLLKLISLECMKKHLCFTEAQARVDGGGKHEKIERWGKAEIGEGRKVLSKEQFEGVMEKVRQKMKGTEFVELWSE